MELLPQLITKMFIKTDWLFEPQRQEEKKLHKVLLYYSLQTFVSFVPLWFKKKITLARIEWQ